MRPEESAEDSTLRRLEGLLLGGPRTLTLRDVAERAGIDIEEARLFWHALGMPTSEPDAVAYTEQDAAVVARTAHARQEFEVRDETAVSLVRSVGHTTDRLVLWQTEALVQHLSERFSLDDASARLLLLDRLGDVLPVLELQLVHAWRRHLAAQAARIEQELMGRHREPDSDELPLARAVGFADIVKFTSRTASLGSHDLADFVQAFETRARDVVTAAGGRVVKTIGDAVLFVADDPRAGAEVALGLAEAFGLESASPVRVGLVWGRVLSRFGDVFGPAVSLAARLTSAAAPGTVLLDPATAAALPAGLLLEEQAERSVPGIGRVRPVRLARPERPARPDRPA